MDGEHNREPGPGRKSTVVMMRECSVRLERCESAVGNNIKTEMDVSAEPHEVRPRTPTISYSCNNAENDDEASTVIVKMEFDSGDCVSTKDLDTKPVHLKQDSWIDASSDIVQECDIIIKREDEMCNVIKQELSIDDTVLQRSTIPTKAEHLGPGSGTTCDDNIMTTSFNTRRDDESTTSTSTGSRGPRGKSAQYYRDYRARKRAEQEKVSLNRTSDPSTTTDSSTINVAGSVTLKKRKSAAEYQREYRARKKAKRDNILIDSLAVIPSTSTGGFIAAHLSTIVDQLTAAGPSINPQTTAGSSINPPTTDGPLTSSDIGFPKPTRRKTPAEYQREYRARKKAQRESTRAAKTNDGSMEVADENTSNIGDENARMNTHILNSISIRKLTTTLEQNSPKTILVLHARYVLNNNDYGLNKI